MLCQIISTKFQDIQGGLRQYYEIDIICTRNPLQSSKRVYENGCYFHRFQGQNEIIHILEGFTRYVVTTTAIHPYFQRMVGLIDRNFVISYVGKLHRRKVLDIS